MGTSKTEYIFCITKRYSMKQFCPVVRFGDIRYNNNIQILGGVLYKNLQWKSHADHLAEQCSRQLNLFKVIGSHCWGTDTTTLGQFYIPYIRSKLTYACEMWDALGRSNFQKCYSIQNLALRICLYCLKTTPNKASSQTQV